MDAWARTFDNWEICDQCCVNYPASRCEAFHRRVIMLHSNFQTNVIGTQKSVYRDPPTGKLEEATLVKRMHFPHQQGFDCDGQTGLSVAIHDLTTVTPEKCIVAGMPVLGHSTAVATPFAGVVGVHSRESDTFVKAPAFKSSLKQESRDAQDFLVEFPAFGSEPFEFLDGEVSIMFQGKIGNVPDDFSNPVFNEVPFSCPEQNKTSSCPMAPPVCKTLEPLASLEDFLALDPDVFPGVKLFNDFAVGGQHGNRETFAVDVHADNIMPDDGRLLFGKERDNLSIRSESIRLAYPACLNQGIVSLVIPVSSDGNCYSLSWIQSEFHEEPAFGVEGFAVSWYVELDSDCVETVSFGSDYIPFDVTDNLTIESGGFFAG